MKYFNNNTGFSKIYLSLVAFIPFPAIEGTLQGGEKHTLFS
jgi:hypothetical protein